MKKQQNEKLILRERVRHFNRMPLNSLRTKTYGHTTLCCIIYMYMVISICFKFDIQVNKFQNKNL